MCVGVSVWLGWGSIRMAGFSLPYGYYPINGIFFTSVDATTLTAINTIIYLQFCEI